MGERAGLPFAALASAAGWRMIVVCPCRGLLQADRDVRHSSRLESNKMKLAGSVQLRVVCDKTPDLSEIIVELHIQSGTKNSYCIVFPKTDTRGLAVLSRSDIVEQFEDTWESGLMDYNGDLNTAIPRNPSPKGLKINPNFTGSGHRCGSSLDHLGKRS